MTSYWPFKGITPSNFQPDEDTGFVVSEHLSRVSV